MLATEFDFELPKGYVDADGNLHRKGVMRLATAADEIYPLKDPRVHNWPAYLIVILLSRVVTKLDGLAEVNPGVIEGLFSEDLGFLQDLYNRVNGLGRQTITTDAPTASTNKMWRCRHWGGHRLPPGRGLPGGSHLGQLRELDPDRSARPRPCRAPSVGARDR